MKPCELLEFLHVIERMKSNTRHSWTAEGRHESVAEHSYRLLVMAFLLRDELPDIDMERVLKLCLVHDWGEALTGDIPSFFKTGDDERREDEAVTALLRTLPEREGELSALFAELNAKETRESRLCRALDMLEAVIQHNEAPLGTWIEREYELNRVYGERECSEFPFVAELRALARIDTEEKTRA
ncbi:MAG: HD domain-containing protein [Oscillospiraceae bacterium]